MFWSPGDVNPEKFGRTGSQTKTKIPTEDKRVVLEWSDTGLPVGLWGKRFNNYLGCIIKRPDYINLSQNYIEQPYNSLVAMWRLLEVIYCFIEILKGIFMCFLLY